MSVQASTGYALNRTRQSYLATHLSIAGTHWSRFRGLMGRDVQDFHPGSGLWIVPCRGIHTFAMNFPIDVLYLDANNLVVYLKENLRPWRVAPISLRAASVLELPNHTLRSSGTAVGDQIEIATGRAQKVDRA